MQPASTPPLRIAIALQLFTFSTTDVMLGMMRFNQRERRFTFRDLLHDDADEIPAKLARMRPDGLVLTLSSPDFARIQTKLPPGLPIVNIGSDLLSPEIPTICNDDVMMLDLAIQHLRELGYKRFAYVGRPNSLTSQRRLKLLQERLPDLAVHELNFVKDCDYINEPGTNPDFERWLAGLRLPVGIIVWCGQCSNTVCWSCDQLGLSIPGDVGVLSLIDQHMCIAGAPTISAIRRAGEKSGYEAMKQLSALLQGKKPSSPMIPIAPRDVIARDSTTKNGQGQTSVQLAIDYIEAHACKGITVKEVLRATQAGSRTIFYKDFLKQVGRSPAEYIRQLKISKAKELLEEEGLSIARIADMCGFKDQNIFGETFRLETNTTPSAYRKKKGQKKKGKKK